MSGPLYEGRKEVRFVHVSLWMYNTCVQRSDEMIVMVRFVHARFWMYNTYCNTVKLSASGNSKSTLLKGWTKITWATGLLNWKGDFVNQNGRGPDDRHFFLLYKFHYLWKISSFIWEFNQDFLCVYIHRPNTGITPNLAPSKLQPKAQRQDPMKMDPMKMAGQVDGLSPSRAQRTMVELKLLYFSFSSSSSKLKDKKQR